MSTETAGEGREGAAATTAEERDGAAAEEYTLQWATRLFRYLESGEKGDPPSPVTPVEPPTELSNDTVRMLERLETVVRERVGGAGTNGGDDPDAVRAREKEKLKLQLRAFLGRDRERSSGARPRGKSADQVRGRRSRSGGRGQIARTGLGEQVGTPKNFSELLDELPYARHLIRELEQAKAKSQSQSQRQPYSVLPPKGNTPLPSPSTLVGGGAGGQGHPLSSSSTPGAAADNAAFRALFSTAASPSAMTPGGTMSSSSPGGKQGLLKSPLVVRNPWAPPGGRSAGTTGAAAPSSATASGGVAASSSTTRGGFRPPLHLYSQNNNKARRQKYLKEKGRENEKGHARKSEGGSNGKGGKGASGAKDSKQSSAAPRNNKRPSTVSGEVDDFLCSASAKGSGSEPALEQTTTHHSSRPASPKSPFEARIERGLKSAEFASKLQGRTSPPPLDGVVKQDPADTAPVSETAVETPTTPPEDDPDQLQRPEEGGQSSSRAPAARHEDSEKLALLAQLKKLREDMEEIVEGQRHSATTMLAYLSAPLNAFEFTSAERRMGLRSPSTGRSPLGRSSGGARAVPSSFSTTRPGVKQ